MKKTLDERISVLEALDAKRTPGEWEALDEEVVDISEFRTH